MSNQNTDLKYKKWYKVCSVFMKGACFTSVKDVTKIIVYFFQCSAGWQWFSV